MSLSINVLTNDVEKQMLHQYYNSHFRRLRQFGNKISDSPIRYENEDRVFSSCRTITLYNNPNINLENPIPENSNLYKTWICKGMNHDCECIHCKLILVKYFTNLITNYNITNNTVIIIPGIILSDLQPSSMDITLRLAYHDVPVSNYYYGKNQVVKDLSSYNSSVYNPNRESNKSCSSYIKKVLGERREYARNLINTCRFSEVEIPRPDTLLCGSTIYRNETVTYSKCIECPNTFECFDTRIDEPCSICLSKECEFITSRPVKLDCGHIFHEGCLTSWFENSSDTCPLCRATNTNISKELVLRNKVRKDAKNLIAILQKQLADLDENYSVNT